MGNITKADSGGSFWTVTTYYNPARYRRRLENFYAFRKNLQGSLLVVEIAKPGHHQLKKSDGDIVIQLTGEDGIWQKEKLINFGISNLPSHVDYCAWVDCDVIFENSSWIEATRQKLESGIKLVQPFESVTHLAESMEPGLASPEYCRNHKSLFTQQSFARAFSNGIMGVNRDSHPKIRLDQLEKGMQSYDLSDTFPTPGLVWAGHRKAIEELGLYDASILGGGDTALGFASIGRPGDYTRGRLSGFHTEHYHSWADRFYQYAQGGIDFVPGSIYHLWHGSLKRRNYSKRSHILKENNFNPASDIRTAATGAWEWFDPDSRLSRLAKEYFHSRKEDVASADVM